MAALPLPLAAPDRLLLLLFLLLSPAANVIGAVSDVRGVLLLLVRSLGGLVRCCGVRGVRVCEGRFPRAFSSTDTCIVCVCVCERVYMCMDMCLNTCMGYKQSLSFFRNGHYSRPISDPEDKQNFVFECSPSPNEKRQATYMSTETEYKHTQLSNRI